MNLNKEVTLKNFNKKIVIFECKITMISALFYFGLNQWIIDIFILKYVEICNNFYNIKN